MSSKPKPDALPMMPWFPRDWIAATRGMTLAARGAYADLLNFQWEMILLPAKPEQLARLLGVPLAEFEPIWEEIGHKFVAVPGGMQNERLEEHRTKALNIKRVRAEAGQRGGKASANAKQLAGDLPQAKCNPPSPSPTPNREEGTASTPRSDNSNLSSTRAARAASRAAPAEMREDWQPNETNQKWLAESGLTPAQRNEVVAEFVRWARLSNLRKTDQNWQLSFSRNPTVKGAIGRAKAANGKVEGDNAAKDRADVFYLAKLMKIEQGTDDFPAFRERVMTANDKRLEAIRRGKQNSWEPPQPIVGALNGANSPRREPRISALERVRRANAAALDEDDAGGASGCEGMVVDG